jgi:antitoxin component YwqK of YwqJK toxin-antitoxin module
MRYLLIIIIVSIFSECQNITQKNIGNKDVYDTSKIFYSNGVIKSLEIYCNGKLQDSARYYFPNGKIERKVLYKNGVMNGRSFNYYPNGNVLEIICANLGDIDTLYFYSEQGILAREILYKNGKSILDTTFSK